MYFLKLKPVISGEALKKFFRSQVFFKSIIICLTVAAAFIIIENGTIPKRYSLILGEKSSYDINATRDIENKLKSRQNSEEAAALVPAVMIEISTASIDVLNNMDDFFTSVDGAIKSVDKNLQTLGINKKSKNYSQQLEVEQLKASERLKQSLAGLNVPLSDEQLYYLVTRLNDEDIISFKKIIKDYVSDIMRTDITKDNLINSIDEVQNRIQNSALNQDLKNIGSILVKTIIQPNRTIDEEKTEENRDKEYLNPRHKVFFQKDERIISVGDVVTEDKLQVLEDLNLLETTSRFDYLTAAGILAMLIFLAILVVLFMRRFCKYILSNMHDLILLGVIITLTLIIARIVKEYSPLLIPVFLATMLISILLDLKLACVINCALVISISFLTDGDLKFMYISAVGGTFSAFLVSKVNQRSRLSMAGIIVGFINALILACIGIIKKDDVSTVANESIIVFLNGIISIVLTIGLLPFLESTFNIITPLKLLELTNPNQTLLKRLLMEAPGTYHHSLMVGNLAEVATESIGGNALLARVGAYFHDIGKLKRPNFFKENQMGDNPHDKMTANLSTLVITSHTQDGAEMAVRYKIPSVIRDIIKQHHGTTLVAYFYHKAKKGEKGELVKPDSFRYYGPKPATKESAVVMLADSVEAAVRSMADKTEGKIEGLIRKIIKDKLDDGQLDLCDLTLKDLDSIAKGFMRILSGFFHEREEYPEVVVKHCKNGNPGGTQIHETYEQESSLDEYAESDGMKYNESGDYT